MGFLGISFLILIAYCISENRRKINVVLIVNALLLQLSIGVVLVSWEIGHDAIIGLSWWIDKLVAYSDAGITYMLKSFLGPEYLSMGEIFALTTLPKLIFFSALISVLYQLGVMGILITFMGRVLKLILKLSDEESLVITSNILLGHIESAIMVKPYVSGMSRSKLFLLMTVGMSTISVGVMGGFSAIGISVEYLVTASIMAMPGSVLFAKIIHPDVEVYTQGQKPKKLYIKRYVNIIDAASNGALLGMQLALKIGATLLAFVSLIALLNSVLVVIGNMVGTESLTLEGILGFVLSPLFFILGVPWDESQIASVLFGKKLIFNEFIAYHDFAQYQLTSEGSRLSQKTLSIITISLFGFGSLSAVAALTAGIGQIASNQVHEVAKLGIKALLASSLVNLTSAAIVGILI